MFTLKLYFWNWSTAFFLFSEKDNSFLSFFNSKLWTKWKVYLNSYCDKEPQTSLKKRKNADVASSQKRSERIEIENEWISSSWKKYLEMSNRWQINPGRQLHVKDLNSVVQMKNGES